MKTEKDNNSAREAGQDRDYLINLIRNAEEIRSLDDLNQIDDCAQAIITDARILLESKTGATKRGRHTLIKASTLSDVNRGLCASSNNCRYRGSTKVYRISFPDNEGNEIAYYATTLWLANAFSNWLYGANWDGIGDPEMKFSESDHAKRYRSSSAKLNPCF